jgi:hypothetical protein
MTRRTRTSEEPDAAVVAAIVAAVAALTGTPTPPVKAIREVKPRDSAWKRVGRQESMRGGWPW